MYLHITGVYINSFYYFCRLIFDAAILSGHKTCLKNQGKSGNFNTRVICLKALLPSRSDRILKLFVILPFPGYLPDI